MSFYDIKEIPEHLRQYFIPAPQIGQEPTPEAYVAEMVAVFREVWRVLRNDGTVWLNLGDSYNNFRVSKGPGQAVHGRDKLNGKPAPDSGGRGWAGAKEKDLLMIPARVALWLQADGWYLRSHIIWHKPNPMPESVRDRPTSAHEYLYHLARTVLSGADSVFLLTKQERYFYDADAVAEQSITNDPRRPYTSKGAKDIDGRSEWKGGQKRDGDIFTTRNLRNVWTITPKPFRGAHFATMPIDLAETCIKAGTSERGCCPACGAAWARVLGDRVATGGRGAGNGFARPERVSVGGRGDETPWIPTARATTGWRPTCECPAHAPIPCTVLDPFGGAGTTGLAAEQLRRRSILMELNPEYVEIARKRLDDARDAEDSEMERLCA